MNLVQFSSVFNYTDSDVKRLNLGPAPEAGSLTRLLMGVNDVGSEPRLSEVKENCGFLLRC